MQNHLSLSHCHWNDFITTQHYAFLASSMSNTYYAVTTPLPVLHKLLISPTQRLLDPILVRSYHEANLSSDDFPTNHPTSVGEEPKTAKSFWHCVNTIKYLVVHESEERNIGRETSEESISNSKSLGNRSEYLYTQVSQH